METMYILNWDSDDTNTDTYGSQIIYQNDGSVLYQNELQPAGKRIHWWQSDYFGDPDPLQNSRYGSKRLPSIPKKKAFSLIFRGGITPQNSVGLNVKSLDEDGQLIKQKMTLSEKLSFYLTDDEPCYEVSLVKFNNKKLEFQDLLMIPKSLEKKYQIQAHFKQDVIDFVPKEKNNVSIGKIIVRQAHRVVDAISIPDTNLNQPLRVVLINDDWTVDKLKQVENEFKTKFQLQQVNLTASDLKSQALLNRK